MKTLTNSQALKKAEFELQLICAEYDQLKAQLIQQVYQLKKQDYKIAVNVAEQSMNVNHTFGNKDQITVRHLFYKNQVCDTFCRGHVGDLVKMRKLFNKFDEALRGAVA